MDAYGKLNLTQDASDEELKARYEELKAQYSEDRFKSGEEGNEGAKNLSELEEAWSIISHDIEKKKNTENFGSELGVIDDLIKQGKLEDAQAELDKISVRNAEWHYLQSIVFYKREWLGESKKQLEIAVSLEPNNSKYKIALEKLELVMGNGNVDPNTIGANGEQRANIPPEMQQQMGCMNQLSNCCMAYCVADCCCNMTRCCG